MHREVPRRKSARGCTLAYAHDIRFDKDDNLWAIDKGSDMIVRFNPEGHVTMVFGRKKEASDEAEPWTRVNPPRPPINGQFRQPTDVTWDPQGNIYISDGYINSRVAKFNKDGDWVASSASRARETRRSSTRRTASPPTRRATSTSPTAATAASRCSIPTTNQFVREITIDVPRAGRRAAVDRRDADRRSRRRRAERRAVGDLHHAAERAGTQYLYSSDAFPGRIYKLTLDGKVLGMLGKSGHQPKQFGWIHEIACPSENELYVAEMLNWRVQKLTLRPTATMSTAGR